MQYRLSTIFLVFFAVATSLALFGAWGLLVSVIALVMAFLLYLRKIEMLVVFSFIFVLIGLLLPVSKSSARNAARRANCTNNMKQLGLGLWNYHDVRKQFPPVMHRDKDGKPLFSWLVTILPYMEYDDIYNALNKDEPWNSPHNDQILRRLQINEFLCPGFSGNAKIAPTNYLAIIGPGTIWRSEGAVSVNDLRNGSSRTVAAIECMNWDKHWAEPYALTVEEFIELLEREKGSKTSAAHSKVVNVLFADGAVRGLPADLPTSLWQKLLMGEINNLDELSYWEPKSDAPLPASLFAGHTPDEPGKWPFLLSIFVWLISMVMLFRRAWKSREMPAKH